jgi:dihydroxy-acid dehydratase
MHRLDNPPHADKGLPMPPLFDTTTINGLVLKNRFMRSATWEGAATEDGFCTPRLTALMEALAEGQVGLIISGHAYVRPDGQAGVRQLGIYTDRQIDGLRRMTAAVHARGGRIVAQITHAGYFANAALTGRPPMALSVVRGYAKGKRNKMSAAHIQELVSAFKDAGRRAREAGFDGVQIHAAHGYFLSQSLSPAFNRRRDRYGGSLEKRARLLLEVLAGLRATVGRDYPLLVKINCADFIDGGLELEEALRIGQWLQDGGIDAIEVSGGTFVSGRLNPSRSRINRQDREAYFQKAANRFKETLRVPIILVGGIRSVNLAQRLLAKGVADYFAMSRPLIREPHLVKRWLEGDTRKATCISDNKCFQTGRDGKGVYCVVEENMREKKKSGPNKPQSSVLTDDRDFPICRVRQVMLRGTGTDLDELRRKPMIAVVNSHTELNPGHRHLDLIGAKVKEGVHAGGGIPFEFNVPAPCDGMSEGHAGMRFILPQRDLIADMVETYVRSMRFDAMVLIAGCDKIIPGMIMAAARLDLPAIFVTGGPSMWESRLRLQRRGGTEAIAGCGACDLMGTANTFQCLTEAMGLTLPGCATVPGFHPDKLVFARRSGKRIVAMVAEDLRARQILSAEAMENAVIMDLALGGSTNATLHLPAIADALGRSLPLETFNLFNRKIPTLLAIRPNGPHEIIDLYAAGGIPAVMKAMAATLQLGARTVTGGTVADVVEQARVLDPDVIPPLERPHAPEGGTVILFGNLAPEGAVVKQSAVAAEMQVFNGTARVMDSEAQALDAFRKKTIREGEVIVIRYEGPKGGPGMPETLAVTMALMASDLKRVALVTDGRFSGATAGPCVGHVSPEACVGGPIAAVRDGDRIDIDIPGRTLSVDLSEEELRKRLKTVRPPARSIPEGYMRRYVQRVGSAAKGAILG